VLYHVLIGCVDYTWWVLLQLDLELFIVSHQTTTERNHQHVVTSYYTFTVVFGFTSRSFLLTQLVQASIFLRKHITLTIYYGNIIPHIEF